MTKMKRQANQFKSIIKSALSEVIDENEALIAQILHDAIEDAFVTKAIKVGRRTKKVTRDKIFQTLAQVGK